MNHATLSLWLCLASACHMADYPVSYTVCRAASDNTARAYAKRDWPEHELRAYRCVLDAPQQWMEGVG
jgi:hypothetical protein